MALDANIVGSTVDSNNNIKVILPTTHAQIGGVRLFSENDDGTSTGVPYLRSPETSSDFRLRVGIDSVWDDENFNYVTQNFNKHKYTSNTLTMTWAGGFLNTNGGNVTTTASGCQLQTWRHFPIQGAGGAYFEQAVSFSNTPVTNWTFDIGAFLPATASTSVPLDGSYFRVTSAGMSGVVNNNGSESTTSVFPLTIAANKTYKLVISISDSEVLFWVDDVLMDRKDRPIGTGSVIYAGSVPWSVRHHHTGVTSGVINAKIANYSVGIADMDNARMWSANKAGQGLSGIQYPSGAAAGLTANNANSAAAASASLSNTAAGYTTLGGRWQFAAVAGAETDYALFAFLNTVPTVNITGRNLVIRGIWIDSMNTGAAVATSATVLEWSLAAGSTAVSLATADGAATRLPKRISLGIQSFPIGAAIGAVASRIDVNLDAPIVVEPATYLHVILRLPIGTATASQIIRGMIGINAYWE